MTKEENEKEIGEEAIELLAAYFDKGYSGPHIIAVLAGALACLLPPSSLNGERLMDRPLNSLRVTSLEVLLRERMRAIN